MPRKTIKTTTTVVTETTEGGGPSKTLVTFLLDRTGSMSTIKNDTIGGFNGYLDQLEREAGDLVEFTLLQFDSMSVDKLTVGAPLKNVPRLTTDTYLPRANTPLIDACVKAIRATEELAARRAVEHPRVVVVFQTDGEENCSREYTMGQLVDLIKDKTHVGWEFVYMGANIDAYQTAQRLGIHAGSTVSYAGQFSAQAMGATASNTAGFARGLSANTAYSMSQKADAGDRFDPDAAILKARAAGKRSRAKPVIDDIKLNSC